MHVKDLDLNLLRLFAEVYRAGSVSRAAERLGLTQPAVSHGLTRLRLLVKDPLFMRAPGGVRPTPRAVALAEAVQDALDALEGALGRTSVFDPSTSRHLFRVHMSDIGEGRFLPELMAWLHAQAPGVRVATQPVPHAALAESLDAGAIDFAFGFLPQVRETRRVELLHDRYVVLMRAGHPMVASLRKLRGVAQLRALQQLDFVAVRAHADTLRILQRAGLQERLRLTTEHFMVLPSIVQATNLCGVMPRNIARGFVQAGGCTVLEPPFEGADFTVSLHWSHRFEADPAHRWFREVAVQLFAEC
ncbi:LysR family transcriptional regulator [Hydrogenophaga sp. YM1]|uniref:LysR family transcriptional regulator n=1 Tax=unclassified Hydrogenophaga TaxID=2610897 RepID=UPI000878A2A7|nr:MULTISPECIES: LysR family transcriptional regulator [unclassified Hydrogenophaga]MBN9369575.1 LysR family transcriptional regulator [Hydrogenophaga sp.]OJV62620.1 MAG: LysR family transcriptional regulator [Hydrogenophaga sp. 70-12]QRR33166.1 LysR family transcriptional regulator [Hydrogenophaga sp. YM1]